MRDNEQRRPEAEADGIIEGRNAVIEALRAGRTIDKIYIAAGDTDKTLGHIASKAKDMGIVVVDADVDVRIFTVNLLGELDRKSVV